MIDVRRAERRAFIRTHHPDVGGDAQVFVTGLAALDAVAPTPEQRVRVIVVPTRSVAGCLIDLVARPWQRHHRVPRVR